jgi:P4 family phage/plasmid primase-like protien
MFDNQITANGKDSISDSPLRDVITRPSSPPSNAPQESASYHGDIELDDFTKNLLMLPPERSPVKGKSPYAVLGTNYAKPALEVALLSAFFNSFKGFIEAAKSLQPGDFYVETNRRIFEAMLAVYNAGLPVTAKNVIARLGAVYPESLEVWSNNVETMMVVSTDVKKIGFLIRKVKAAAAIRGGNDYCPDDYSESFCSELFNLKAGQIRCVDKVWRRYEDGAWGEIAPGILMPLAVGSIHPAHLDSRKVQGIIELVRMKRQVPPKIFKGAIRMGKGSILINAKDCVIKITARGTPVRVRQSPRFGFTRTIASSFDPSATCPLFTEKLKEMLPDPDDRELLQVFCGSILYPSSEYETALVAYGPGGTGKSTIAMVIREVLGNDNVGSAGLEDLCGASSYVLPTLKWKLVNIGSELRGSEEVESANFKKLVTGETMNVRAIYRDPEDMTTTCKFMFLSNNLPRFKDGTDAELRRLRMLHFHKKPKNIDAKLKEKLAAETSGIFNWMLEGLGMLITNKSIPQGGQDAQAVLASFNKDNDKVGAFVKERCILDPSGRVAKTKLFEAFCEWCEDNGHSPEKMENYFFKKLLERHHLSSSRIQVNGKRTHCFLGISLIQQGSGPEIEAKEDGQGISDLTGSGQSRLHLNPMVQRMLERLKHDRD